MDWFERGKVDGRRGSSAENSFTYQNQCDQFGIKLFDEKNYFGGRAEGLASFCTYQNGEDVGKEGNEDSSLDAKSPYWTEIRIFSDDGKPVKTIPLDGYFEIQLPKALFEDNPKSITINWIDFYR